jgi:hypothetical protein
VKFSRKTPPPKNLPKRFYWHWAGKTVGIGIAKCFSELVLTARAIE